MIVDNTQGGDAVIARDPAIRSIEDLAGRSVALLQFTPSHGMLIDAIENSSLTARKKESVKTVFINAEEGTAGVRAALESGNVDAAVLWDPDLSLAVRNVKGAHVVYSTKTATNLIFDVMVCDSRVLATPEGQAVVQKFVEGWMEGVEAAQGQSGQRRRGAGEDRGVLQAACRQGRAGRSSRACSAIWCGPASKTMPASSAWPAAPNHYERVYRRFDEIYRKAGALANPKSPVIAPQDSFDYRFIKAHAGHEQARRRPPRRSRRRPSPRPRCRKRRRTTAIVTKPVMVGFATGSAELTKRAQKTIDTEMVPFIENNGKAYFEVSGNSDSTGARETNMRLSAARARRPWWTIWSRSGSSRASASRSSATARTARCATRPMPAAEGLSTGGLPGDEPHDPRRGVRRRD